MKIFNTSEYSEKLKIRQVNVKNIDYTYSCKPQSTKELADIIKKRMIEKGEDCDLNDIDVSEITDMRFLFKPDYFDGMQFNGDISKWDVSNVYNMGFMFCGLTKFNCDISGWNVSSVINMRNMFHNCNNFNQDISGWDVSKVETMECMFYNASAFNQDISEWDVSKVTDMRFIFNNAKKFDQDLSSWNTKKVGCTFHIFDDCPLENNKEKQPVFSD